MDAKSLQVCFLLGVSIAEHVHGAARRSGDGKTKAVFQTLKEIADGSLTLQDTAAELKASLPALPDSASDAIIQSLERARAADKKMAAELVNALPPEVFE